MYKIRTALLSLVISAGSATARAEELPPPPNEDRFLLVRNELDEYCHSKPPCEESRLYCFLEQVHVLKETGRIDEPLFQRLLHEGQMRMSYRRGFDDGSAQCRKMPPPDQGKPEPKPEPKPTPKPEPKPEEKVTICHIPPGNESNAHTIKVGKSAVEAHLKHGDTLGECKSDSGDGKKDKGDKGSDKGSKGKGKGSDKGKSKDKGKEKKSK